MDQACYCPSSTLFRFFRALREMMTFPAIETGTLTILLLDLLIISWRLWANWRLLRRQHQQIDLLLAQPLRRELYDWRSPAKY